MFCLLIKKKKKKIGKQLTAVAPIDGAKWPRTAATIAAMTNRTTYTQ